MSEGREKTEETPKKAPEEKRDTVSLLFDRLYQDHVREDLGVDPGDDAGRVNIPTINGI